MGISGLAGENKIKQNYTFFCLHLIVVLVVFNSILVFFIIIIFLSPNQCYSFQKLSRLKIAHCCNFCLSALVWFGNRHLKSKEGLTNIVGHK